MPTLWTIGHGARSFTAFLEALQAHGIAILADVRHFPGSRKHPHFGQGPMKAALEAAGLRYEHLVDLGGFRKGGYEAYMATPEWARGFDALVALAEEAPTAICCAETVPWKCHRRYIAQRAAEQGWFVSHILDAKRTLPHRAPRQARLDL